MLGVVSRHEFNEFSFYSGNVGFEGFLVICEVPLVSLEVVDFIFELAETAEQIEAFAALMDPLGLVELTRTGTAAMSRGSEVLS